MKNLLLIALALFMFVACSKSEIDEDPQPEPVKEKNFAHYLKGPYPDSIFTLPKYTTIKFAVAYHIKDNEISNNGFYLKEKVAKKINEKYRQTGLSSQDTKNIRSACIAAPVFSDINILDQSAGQISGRNTSQKEREGQK